MFQTLESRKSWPGSSGRRSWETDATTALAEASMLNCQTRPGRQSLEKLEFRLEILVGSLPGPLNSMPTFRPGFLVKYPGNHAAGQRR